MDIYGAPSGMPTNQHNADGGNATARTENNIRNEQPVESDVTGNPLHRHSDRSAGDHRLSDIEMGSTDRTRLAPIAIGNSAPAAVASQRRGSSSRAAYTMLEEEDDACAGGEVSQHAL